MAIVALCELHCKGTGVTSTRGFWLLPSLPPRLGAVPVSADTSPVQPCEYRPKCVGNEQAHQVHTR